MTVTLQSLAQSQLANAKATIYTVPSGDAGMYSVTYVNTDTSERTVNLYVKLSGGTSRNVIPPSLPLAVNGMCIRRLKGLSAGDLIEGHASVASKVDYTIMGIEDE